MDLHTFNQSLLIKWHWKWTKPEQALWKPMFRYTGAKEDKASPLFGKALKQAYQFCTVSFRHIVGDGRSILLWHQDWGLGILKHEYNSLYSHALDDNITLHDAINARPLATILKSQLTSIHGSNTAATSQLQFMTGNTQTKRKR